MLAFQLREVGRTKVRQVGYGHSILKVYPTVILQLTTLSLLMSFSSGAVAVLPAIYSPAATPDAPVVEAQTISLKKEIRSADYMPISDSKNVERFLADYFADIPLMTKIARCESRNRHLDKNGNVLKGEITDKDTGVMQINLYFHEKTAKTLGYDLHNLDDNVAYARYLYEREGAKPWMSSSKCWSKLVDSEIAKK